MTTKRRSSSGSAVTDELVQLLADEAEAGFSVKPRRPAGARRPSAPAASRVVSVRLDPELEQALRERAAADGSNASEVIREALRAWLHTA